MSELLKMLGKLLDIPPISIEILPGDGSEWFASDLPPEVAQYAPFLLVEGNLGIPQKIAYKAYLQSILTFRQCRSRLRAQPEERLERQDSCPLTNVDTADTIASSGILLLINPAHQSALDVRKRLVQLGKLDAAHELRFVSALLTLREASKQSLLWHHRRWLLRRIHCPIQTMLPHSIASSSGTPHFPQGDGEDSLWGVSLDANAFRAEFAATGQACEIYPRNYHAWTHRFLCAEALAVLLTGNAQSTPDQGLVEVWHEERAHIRVWVERHVSDYSAMQYACRFEELGHGLPLPALEATLLDRTPRGSTASQDSKPDRAATVLDHAWSLVQAYPTHESLWLYLRGALSPAFSGVGVPSSGRVVGDVGIVAEARAFAGRLLSDDSRVAAGGGSEMAEERALVKAHAGRFLGWVMYKEGILQPNSRNVRQIAMAVELGDISDLLIQLQEPS
ncbi:hypothetical protein BD413DRAFT_265444 [Trametes elegans]|nr:hypothetical protein BD413DRAFT_265444 [Trametes elegans]